MHGFAETAATFAFAIAAWPLVAAAVVADLAGNVRWRLLFSTDPQWESKLRSDARRMLALWREDLRRLFPAD